MKKYFWMLFVGIVATFSYIITIWTNHVGDTIINIIAMIGSGLFCSALVSYRIEYLENKRTKMIKGEQRDYILSSIKMSLFNILSLEYNNLSRYLALHDTKNKYKKDQEEIEITAAMDKLCDWLDQISGSLSSWYKLPPIIDLNDVNKINESNRLAFQAILPHYEKLYKDLLKIHENSYIYLIEEIFNEEQLDKIHSVLIDVDAIITYSNEICIDGLFEFKKTFITNLSNLLDIFHIERSKKIKCCYQAIDNQNSDK